MTKDKFFMTDQLVCVKRVLCPNCGIELVNVGNARMVISDIHYNCKCGSTGMIQGIITDFKPDEK